METLIAYFSRKGNNYVSGKIVNLPIGNTEVIANMIKDITGGDLFQIETKKPYPEDYTETTKVADKEYHSNARPELSTKITDINKYDIIYLGYPNWWGTMPMPVHTFLESYDLSNKIIIPFCTHEGSGLGHSVKDIVSLCPKSKVANAKPLLGSNVKNARSEVEQWINEGKFAVLK
jgi:flavodoxin